MRERPILFSAPMVLAILAGKKRQTRRIFKFRKPTDHLLAAMPDGAILSRCPYGQPGDRLWVRETWAPCEAPIRTGQFQYAADGAVGRQVDFGDGERTWRRSGHTVGITPGGPDGVWVGPPSRWRPSIHMPRRVSRLTLEITGVRVERLQDISEKDARAEGVDPCSLAHTHRPHRCAFERLWNEINDAESWALNPWVWVVQFRRVDATASKLADQSRNEVTP